jgi:kynurenine 3-monooxygenase
MVPFYGQGMNAGFEDVRVLFEHIRAHSDLSTALSSYSETRKANAHSINDLAMTNYVEMRANVTSSIYKARKRVEEVLYDYLPMLSITTQYALVSFSNTPYSKVISHMKWQKRVLNAAATCLVFGTIGLVAWIPWGKRFVGKGDALIAIAKDVWHRAWGLL